jgi:hypothetical protein
MPGPDKIETVALKRCHFCSAESLDRDRFCRRCGACLIARNDPTTGVIGSADGSEFKTSPLFGSGPMQQSYSGPLVRILTQELLERTSSLGANRWARPLVSVLVAVPLWLMIVLLSPIDTYIAAKAIAKQV